MPPDGRARWTPSPLPWIAHEDAIARYLHDRLRAWVDRPDREPAITAFTAGLERDVARLVERGAEATLAKARLACLMLLEELTRVDTLENLNYIASTSPHATVLRRALHVDETTP